MPHKTWLYDKAVKKQFIVGIIFLGASNAKKWRITKLETLERTLTIEAQERHAASWQAQKPTPPFHRNPGIPKATLFD